MNDKHTQDEQRPDGRVSRSRSAGGAQPEWATGLKRLYDQVVNEPLPDQFRDLLAKLDEPRK